MVGDLEMRILVVLVSTFLWLTNTQTTHAQHALYEGYLDYRMVNLRRHNDTPGVEVIFDDYRRNWLRRYNSELLVGNGAHKSRSDIPHCSRLDGGKSAQIRRAYCGGGHVFRAHVGGIAAADAANGSADETGFLGYLGYEYLWSDDRFFGFGATFGRSTINYSNSGNSLSSKTNDLGIHLFTGYRFKGGSMTLWNVSFILADDALNSNGTFSQSNQANGILVTGVWYDTYDFSEDFYLSYGIDYTFHGMFGGHLAHQNGADSTRVDIWRGDLTGSLMYVKEKPNGEMFAKINASIEVLNVTRRPFDIGIDVGGSWKLGSLGAVTGTLGGFYRVGGYTEARGSLRVVGKF